MIVEPFPKPPPAVRHALVQLQIAGTGSDADLDEIGDPALLPRPWDPATCVPSLRAYVWQWLDDVVAWINRGYAWTPASCIPDCWPEHPHIAHELAVVASLRLIADQALTPQTLEEWHRYVLPGFLDRMTQRLGISCPPGKHTAWPARGRHTNYCAPEVTQRRADLYEADMGDCVQP